MKTIVKYIIFVTFISFGVVTLSLRLYGYNTYVVISDSMAPAVRRHSFVYVKPLSVDEPLLIGDIVTVKTTGIPLMHRIVEITNAYIITKGDANEVNDSNINRIDINGKMVFSIPIIGLFFSSVYPLIIMILIILSFGIYKQLKNEFKKH